MNIPSIHYYLAIPGVFLLSLGWLLSANIFYKTARIKASPVSYDSASKMLERLSAFTTWLTGLQTAAIAAIGLLAKGKCLTPALKIYGFYAVLFFGASIVMATWLLSGLPSVQGRLGNSGQPEKANDIYMARIFPFIPFRLGRFTGMIHTYFLVGIVFFSLFILEFFSL